MKTCWMIPEITVVSATAFRINSHARAIQQTLKALPISARGLLISSERPTIPFDEDWVSIEPSLLKNGLWTREDYSWFILSELVSHIKTRFCIIVQWDGFALNKDRWTDEFLNYDYIGAPWPSWMNIGRVGNGGFSLRSRKWIELSSKLLASSPFDSPGVYGSEDCYCCKKFRHIYERAGLKIAPVSLAMNWSLEHPIEEYPGWTSDLSFGFHGFYHPSNLKHQPALE